MIEYSVGAVRRPTSETRTQNAPTDAFPIRLAPCVASSLASVTWQYWPFHVPSVKLMTAALSGLGVDNVAGFFGSIGVPAAGLVAWFVTIVELVGGLFLIAGFLTEISSILLMIVMLGAIIFRYLGQGVPFIDGGAISFDKEAVFAAAALCLLLSGPGAWSVDDIVIDTRRRA